MCWPELVNLEQQECLEQETFLSKKKRVGLRVHTYVLLYNKT